MKSSEHTFYASIEKPWLKYYSKEAQYAPLPDCSIYEFIQNNNNNFLSDIALRFFGNKITYETMFSKIDAVSNALLHFNVSPGDVVAVCMPATPEAVYIVYALNKIGAIPNMLNPGYNEGLLEYCLKESPCSLLLTYDGCYDKFLHVSHDVLPQNIVIISALLSAPPLLRFAAGMKNKTVQANNPHHIFWNDFIQAKITNHQNSFSGWKPDECCIILYTGGTTGNPKGVMLSNRSINSIAHQYKMLVQPKRGEILLDIIPPFASYGLCTSMHMPLSLGLSIEMIPKFEAAKFGDLLAKYKPNYVMGVPSFYESMLSNKKLKNSSMSYLLSAACGGDSISIPTEKKINDFLEAHNSTAHVDMGYGMSEMSATACVCFKKMHRPGSVGVPFVKTVFKIVNPETMEECKYNETGEICISGPGMMVGYLNNPELTKKTIRIHSDGKKWVHTGDLGHITVDGFVFHDGRIKRMIVRYDGFKIYPSAVEQAIMKHPYVQSCAVVKYSKENLGSMPKAFIVLKNGMSPSDEILAEIINICNDDLAEKSVPQDFTFVQHLPLTSMGKIDYRALEQQAEQKKASH